MVGVAGNAAFDAMPGRACCGFGFLPFETCLAGGVAFVVRTQFGFQLIVCFARGSVTGVTFPARAEGGFVIFVTVISFDPRLARVVVAPIGGFNCWIDCFGSAFPGETTSDRADHCANSSANRTAHGCADRCASSSCRASAYAGSDRVRTWRTCDWITICIYLAHFFFCTTFVHISLSVCFLHGTDS